MIALGLTAVSAALRFAVSFLGFESGVGLIGGAAELFDVQNDKTIPTWFSSLLLLIAAILIWQLQRAGSSEPWATRGPLLRTLTAGFLLMSIDETASIHEHLNDPLAKWVAPTGPFRFGWVLVGIPFVILVAAFFGRWVLSLPSPDRSWVILGGVLFVVGAIGFEMLGSELLALHIHGVEGGVAHIEELCEMLGVVAFIEGTVRLLRRTGWDGRLRFAMLTESSQPTSTGPVAEVIDT